MDFSQGLLDRIKDSHNCISKSRCLQMFYKGRSYSKSGKIYRKTPLPEFFVINLQAAAFRNAFFYITLLDHCFYISDDLTYAPKNFQNFLLNLQLC